MNSSLHTQVGSDADALILMPLRNVNTVVAPRLPIEESNHVESQRPLLSVEDVARLSSLHPEVVRREIRAGKLGASKLRNRLRIRPEHFEEWIDDNRVVAGGSDER